MRYLFYLLAPLAYALPALAEVGAEQRAFFENKIRPVLAKHCYECHAEGAKKLGGKLLLDSAAGLLQGGESGPALLPGKPAESLLLQALRYEGGLEMPPRERLPEQVIADFTQWIQMGAPDPRSQPVVAAVAESSLWSLQPLRPVQQLPAVKDSAWPRTVLDVLALQQMEEHGVQPVEDASPAALLRRLCFDLTGLPPAALGLVGTKLPLASVVDQLLASPHFGEHWGRHWLDVVRYAECNGNDGLSRNPSFPHAWRYRDYVITAFNEDVPYDRFITEQLAGDLLPAATPAERDRLLIATGLLALGAKPAKAMNDNFEMDVVADQIQVLGTGIMGLSVGCARCHDHKTDPIPTRDYYALAGIFKSTETLWGAAAREALTAPQTALHELKAAPALLPHPGVEAVLASHKPRKTPAKATHSYAPDAPLAMGAREAKVVADCKLNIDGEAKKLGAAIPRGFLSAIRMATGGVDAKQSGRLQLAQWLTHPQHPLTARVMVNRVWQQLFGTGLVRTVDDFGAYGEAPTHPQLLDTLAAQFMQQQWSMKQLIRSMVLSRTYQLAARSTEPAWLCHHSRRRLPAEAIRDAMLCATGELRLQPASGSLIQQRDVLINELPPLHQPTAHRSIYLLMLRTSMPGELTPFNLPDALAPQGRREASPLPTQSLYLLNHGFVVQRSQHFAQQLLARRGSAQQRIQWAYAQALGRAATAAELQRAEGFLLDAEGMLSSSAAADDAPAVAQSNAWAALCQALLICSEMRYVD